MSLPSVYGLTRDELGAQLAAWGQPAYRADQVLDWLYVRRVTAWDAMTNLPKTLREQLGATWGLPRFELVAGQDAGDGTHKFLWRLADGSLIESVLIPANPAFYGEGSDRQTLCVSTQVGCAYGCRFCASGLHGWRRDLHPDEIVSQALAVEQWHAQRTAACPPDHPVSRESRLISNLVIMGMGEPLANYNALLRALRILNAPWGGGIGARKITVSTSGLVPQIRRLAEEPEQFRLAISLHGATDAVRDQLMPVNRKYPLRELLAACDHYCQRKGRVLTLEYILIHGVNDAPVHADDLARVAQHLAAKVNLIPYNPVAGLEWERPPLTRQQQFHKVLLAKGIQATLRNEKGGDIEAACGQLRLRTEPKLDSSGTGFRPESDGPRQ